MTTNYIKITDDHTIPTSELYKRIKDKFGAWSYWDEKELDKEFPMPKETTTRYFSDAQEADEEHKNKSANDLDKEGVNGITLRERLIFEIEYFDKYKQHPDIENTTLCSGSRYSGGDVPCVGWDIGSRGVGVCWDRLSDSDSALRTRAAVNPSNLNLVPSAIKVSRTYEIEGNRVEIRDGKISLKRKSGRQDFVFKGSTPETCEKIAQVLTEAAKLARLS